jgi:transposase InsO family protein
MRYSAAEKREIIHMVEHSDLSIRKTLEELDVPRSSFYRWYRRYQEDGPEGLEPKKPHKKRFWNKIPDSVKDQVVELALEHPDESSRQLAWKFTDEEGYFLSESSVYRILKDFDLLENQAFEIIPVKEKFEKPTKRVNELWQTDFTQFKIVGWGWYYLSTVLDDYSRYILSWKLTTTMNNQDVQDTLEVALDKAGIEQVRVKHRPRLLSDNGPAYLSGELKSFLSDWEMQHFRSAPYHPMTQGKIERWHRSMKNVVKLRNYYYPWELEQAIEAFVEYYNHERYHESLENLTPIDVYSGREKEVLSRREQIKQETLEKRRRENLGWAHV